MRSIKGCAAALLGLSLALEHAADAGTINFDDVSSGTVIDSQYASQQVTFSALPGKLYANDGHVYARSDGYARSGPNSIGLSNTPFAYVNDTYGYIDVHFNQLQGTVSVDVAAIVVSEIATAGTLPPYMMAYGARDPATGKNPLLASVYYPSSLIPGLSTGTPGAWQTLTITRPTNDIQFVILSAPKVYPASPNAYGEFDNLRFGLSQPDLAISALQAPATASAGQVIAVTDTTTNLGTAWSSASVTNLYWSSTPSFTAAAVLVGSHTVPGLAPGASSGPVTTSIAIPSGAAGGKYVLAVADGGGWLTEANEANNTRATRVFVGRGPDLVVSALGVSTGPLLGGMAISYTVRNTGTAAARPFRVCFSRVQLPISRLPIKPFLCRQVAELAAGAEFAEKVQATRPLAPPGELTLQTIEAIADADRVIDEIDETNNTRSVRVRL